MVSGKRLQFRQHTYSTVEAAGRTLPPHNLLTARPVHAEHVHARVCGRDSMGYPVLAAPIVGAVRVATARGAVIAMGGDVAAGRCGVYDGVHTSGRRGTEQPESLPPAQIFRGHSFCALFLRYVCLPREGGV